MIVIVIYVLLIMIEKNKVVKIIYKIFFIKLYLFCYDIFY